MAYEDALVALADPTRRAVLERLRRRPHTVGELAELVHISQPAVSQHLRVLSRARLVTHEARGTRRNYRASAEGLEALRAWLESMWDDILVTYSTADPAPPKRKKRR